MPGNETEDSPTDTDATAADAYALVGNEIRAEIIQVLGDKYDRDLSLSEIRSELAADVEPSQLHYHLQQLVGHFVEKTPAGYRITGVGRRLSWTLRAGSINRRDERITTDANVDCYYCPGRVEAIFDNGSVRVRCPDCEHLYMVDFYEFSLALFEDGQAAFEHFSTYQTIKMLELARGTCPSCTHSLSPTIIVLGEDRNRTVEINYSCDVCSARWWQSVGMALRADPVLMSFCINHGIDVLSTPWWELEFAATDKLVTVRSTDPWEVALEVTFDDDTLELVVDDELNVLEHNRMDASDQENASLLRGIQSSVRLMGSMEGEDGVDLPDNQACLEYLRRHRWPDGVVCPHCDGPNTIKKGTTGKDAQRYRCQDCESIFNDLTGTIFAEYGLSLPEMFYIIQELEGTDATQLARQLDRSYQTVLDFIHDVQDALADESDATLSGA